MSVTAQAADGTVHEFPDGTDPTVIDKVMKDYAVKNATGSVSQDQGAAPHDSFWDANKPDFQDQALHSMTFGLGDKLVAGVEAGRRAVFDGKKFGPEFENLTAARDQQFKDYREEHPILGKVAQTAGVVGSMAAIGPAEGATTAATWMGRAVQGGKASATAGGLASAGSSRGDVKDQLIATAVGTLVSGAAGLIVTPLFELGAKTIGSAANRISGTAKPERKAAMTLAKAMARDNETPASIAGKITDAADQGVPMMPLDTGENMRGLARGLETKPGAARTTIREALTERAAGQPERVADKVRNVFGGDASDLEDAAKTILARRAANAETDFAAAHAEEIPVSGQITRMLQTPAVKSAIPNALKIAGNEGDDVAVAELTGLSGGGVPKTISGKVAHYLKQGLDDVVEGSRDKVTGKLVLDTSGRSEALIRDRWSNAIKDASPAYRQAVENWGDDASLLDAAKFGQRVFDGKVDTKVFVDRVSKLTDAEREMGRLGVAKKITDEISKTTDGRDVIAKVFGSEAKRVKLRAFFPNADEFMKFEGAMRLEAALSRPYGGSQTAPLMAEQADLAESLAEGLARSAIKRDVVALWRVVKDHYHTFGLDERASQMIAEYLVGKATGNPLGGLATKRLASLAEGNLRVRLAIQAGDRALGEAAGQITAQATK